MPDSPFTLEHDLHDGVCEVRVSGRLDSKTAPTAQSAFVDAIHSHPRVLLDCSNVNFMSSGGLRAIIIAHRAARDQGKSVSVWITSQPVMETVQVAAIDKVVPIHTTRTAAVAALK